MCRTCLALSLILALTLQRGSLGEMPPAPLVTLAQELVACLARGEFERATAPFDATLQKGLPADKLQAAWEGLVGQFGKFQATGKLRHERAGDYQVVLVLLRFERASVDAKIAFDSHQKIAGLFFVPAGKYESPTYVKPDAFIEEDATVGQGLLSLAGTLSLPKGDGPFPAVVLVHGSGPNDRDETIGPNKPFRDLAQGLASQGIAALRYEKRTRQHALALALFASRLTVKEETIDDAVAAIATAAKHPKIDPDRVFVLGHSLGGMLLPRIAAAGDRAAGFISLAGSTRPLEDLILDQTRYILSLDGTLDEREQAQIAALQKQVALVKSDQLSTSTLASDLPLGIPARYWLDLQGYDPALAAQKIERPLLVLQGERDYQVTLEDFAGWKQSLAGRKNVQFIAYPALNHLFIASFDKTPKSTPAEYTIPGNVAAQVIDDLAKWIQAH